MLKNSCVLTLQICLHRLSMPHTINRIQTGKTMRINEHRDQDMKTTNRNGFQHYRVIVIIGKPTVSNDLEHQGLIYSDINLQLQDIRTLNCFQNKSPVFLLIFLSAKLPHRCHWCCLGAGPVFRCGEKAQAGWHSSQGV